MTQNRVAGNSQNLEDNKEDLEVITQVLVRMTNLTPEQIQPHLDYMVERLRELKQTPSYKTTPEERARAFREWASSHDRNTLLLSDYAVSRESIYDDERL
ncbi:hypothetical protein [Chroococcidiopsis sp. CCMEE 29]|uniref:hypothetical protein n=1 Tax=Chroococcidiopsis sp. CCMEE 29 TaxID=155894 RepID=UPI00202187BF|nr:hypothetical protein [Chroococcidiopsis sp. CCMEE 29]